MQSSEEKRLFCFGLGYSAGYLARQLRDQGWLIAGTTRSAEKAEALEAEGFAMQLFDGTAPLEDLEPLLQATHLLTSIKPEEGQDPVLAQLREEISSKPDWQWVGYLSTTGVYGNSEGAWVDEMSSPRPSSDRNAWRVEAEAAWMALHTSANLPVHIFRLAGIYGPGRNQLRSVKAGKARRLDKPGQFFSRIHVEDIAGALAASIARPHAGQSYNVCDDLPDNPATVVAYAADLLGLEPPPLVDFERADLSPMARSFYLDNRRVSNAKLRHQLGYELRYPTYREGLQACLKAESF